MPSGLGGYATSRDNRASFTLASPARAICSWREWVGEGTPCTSRTPRGPKIQQDGSLKSAWYQNEWIKIWMKIILFVTWADTMEIGEWIRLLQWEWEHVWGFSGKQWWKESNCYNSRGEDGRKEVWMHANIYTYSTQAQMHSVERHNSGHSSCIGKWNKGTESRSLWLVCECWANLILHCLRSDEWQIYRDTDLSLAMTSLHWEYSRNEVMSRHSMSRRKVRAFGMWDWSMAPTLTHMSTHEHTCRIYIECRVHTTPTHHNHAITQPTNTRPVHLLASVQGISPLHIISSTHYPRSLFERKPLWSF